MTRLDLTDGFARFPETLAEGILHVSSGLVARAELDASEPWVEELVDWMVRTGAWPSSAPTVLGNDETAEGLRDRIAAYWRPRVDLHRAPRLACWAIPGDDAADVMGCWAAEEAAISFARGRWRKVGKPATQLVVVLDETLERRFEVAADFTATEL